MKKVFLVLIFVIIGFSLYESRPGYVVFIGRVYYNNISEGVGYKRIHMNADAKTFMINKEFPAYGMDKNKAYYYGKPIFDSDGATFEILQGGYQKDKKPCVLPESYHTIRRPKEFQRFSMGLKWS